MAKTLNQPSWLTADDVIEIEAIGGFVPLKTIPIQSSLFRIRIFDDGFIYLVIAEREITEIDVFNVLTGKNNDPKRDFEILEIGW